MKQRTRILLALIAVAGTLLAAESPALAGQRHERMILTYVFNDPDHVTTTDALVAEMRHTGNLERFGLKPGVETTLHRAGAKPAPGVASYATQADTREPSAVTPMAATKPEMSPEECIKNDQSSEPAGWIKNHFQY